MMLMPSGTDQISCDSCVALASQRDCAVKGMAGVPKPVRAVPNGTASSRRGTSAVVMQVMDRNNTTKGERMVIAKLRAHVTYILWMNQSLRERLARGPLVCDGPLDAMLMGLNHHEVPIDLYNLTQPVVVE